MSSDKSAKLLKRLVGAHRDWAEPLARVVFYVSHLPPQAVVDPTLVAEMAGVKRLEAIGYLNVLRDAGLGQFIVRVLDNSGIEIRRYDNVVEVPGRVEDQFGDEFIVMPENIDIGFLPSPAVRQLDLSEAGAKNLGA
jgi:hypothetical protein